MIPIAEFWRESAVVATEEDVMRLCRVKSIEAWICGARGVANRNLSRNLLLLLIGSGLLVVGSGCRLCCDLEDAAYSAYGGAWERTNRETGRVGSVFDPGGALAADLAPRASAGDKKDALDRIAPGLKGRENEMRNDPSLQREAPRRRSDEETEQQFQDRLRQFKEQQDQENDNPLNAGLILGEPQPPAMR